MSTENKALVRRWFEEVWNKRSAAAIDEMLAPDAVVHGLGPTMRGPEEFKQFYVAYCNAFPDLRLQVEDVIAEGDRVAARWIGSGTHQGDGLGFASTGLPAHFAGMTIVRVKDGRLVEGWNSFNQLEMLQQLGVVSLPSPG